MVRTEPQIFSHRRPELSPEVFLAAVVLGAGLISGVVALAVSGSLLVGVFIAAMMIPTVATAAVMLQP